ncbi:MAG: hypothetical protein HY762_02290 [Planctomycetes bacterium]|nr:hypothetical protein [Planctomycetota bacterium]
MLMKTKALWLIILGLLLCLPLWAAKGDDKPPEFEMKLQKAFEEISTLNLINGLNLTQDQIKQIIECNKELETLRQDCNKEFESVASDTMDAYGKLKEAVEKNQGIPKDVERKAFMMEQQVKQIREEMMSEASNIEKKLEAVLTEAQMEVVNTFNPCLIPPKNLKEPVRAGQANDNDHILNMFKRIRSLPSDVYDKEKDKIVSRHLEEIQKHIGNLTQEELEQEKQNTIAVFDKVRAMKDVEFELNGPEVATEYMKHGKKLKGEELRDEMMKLNQTRHGGLGRVGRYLLGPTVVQVLTKRLEMMKS